MPDQSAEVSVCSTRLPGAWTRFAARFKSREDALARELSTSWNDLNRLLADSFPENVRQSIAEAGPACTLAEFLDLRTQAAEALLLSPLAQVNRSRPLRRATAAIERYERALDGPLGELPEEIAARGIEVLAATGKTAGAGIAGYLARLRRKPHRIQVRAIAARELETAYHSRAAAEGRCLSALLQAAREVRSPWHAARGILDERVAGAEHAAQLEPALGRIQERRRAIEAQAPAALRARSQWGELATHRISRRLIAAAGWGRARTVAGRGGRTAENLQYWAALSRALESEAALGVALEACERELLKLGLSALAGIRQERDLLIREISVVIDWLEQQTEAARVGTFPPPAADIVPASSRAAEFEEGLIAALKVLPEHCTVPGRIGHRAGRRPKLRPLHPRHTFHDCYVRAGRDTIRAVFERLMNEHCAIAQAIERAREVVAFARETVNSDETSSPVLREGLENALSLLKYHRDESPHTGSAADAELARCLAAVFDENRLMLSRHGLAGTAHVVHHGTRRALVEWSAEAVARLEISLRHATARTEKALQRFLVYIGWQPAPKAGQLEVITRPFLPREFTVDLSAKEIPALYRHLFRFDPVQDPRFLVGRDREMAAIEQARAFWESRRPVALILVGERGSGKTSLINCAIKRCLGDLDLLRGEFGERILTAAGLRQFLAGLLATEPERVEETLARGKRVIILEELERSFLRQVGCFHAIRDLQRLIAATCASTLWILAINELAFQFLNAAVNLGQTFSHRVNAGTAAIADLRQAILLRHELSGLRLQFPPPAPAPRRSGQIPLRLRKARDPETEFFELLSRESGGVFRSAFDMWLGQIEGAEAGILYMKRLETPDLSRLMDDLSQEDVFTLLTIPQHGGLTAEEHAAVFQKPLAASRGIIDGLLARELIEPDPGRRGFRVRPEAMRIVRETLYRRNLI